MKLRVSAVALRSARYEIKTEWIVYIVYLPGVDVVFLPTD